jgi:hypothetical protein
MSKPKATVHSLRKELEAQAAVHEAYKARARAYVLATSSDSSRRALMTIDPVTKDGKVNGITIAELIMLVNLAEGTGEQVILETTYDKQRLFVVAKKKLCIWR